MQAGLQEWLGDLIEVTDVEIENAGLDAPAGRSATWCDARGETRTATIDEVTMAGLRYLCCSDARRAALEQRPDLNGIDFLEVGDLDPTELDAAEAAEYAALPVTERDRLLWQRRLELFFVNPLLAAHLASLTDANFRITGGERAGVPHHRAGGARRPRRSRWCCAPPSAATSRPTASPS